MLEDERWPGWSYFDQEAESIQAVGDVRLSAVNVSARDSNVTSTQGPPVAVAGSNLSVTAGKATCSLDEAHRKHQSAWCISAWSAANHRSQSVAVDSACPCQSASACFSKEEVMDDKVALVQKRAEEFRTLLDAHQSTDSDAALLLKWLTPLFDEVRSGRIVPPRRYEHGNALGKDHPFYGADKPFQQTEALFVAALEDWCSQPWYQALQRRTES